MYVFIYLCINLHTHTHTHTHTHKHTHTHTHTHTLRKKKAFANVPQRLLWKLENTRRLKGTIKNCMEDYLKVEEIKSVVKNENQNGRNCEK